MSRWCARHDDHARALASCIDAHVHCARDAWCRETVRRRIRRMPRIGDRPSLDRSRRARRRGRCSARSHRAPASRRCCLRAAGLLVPDLGEIRWYGDASPRGSDAVARCTISPGPLRAAPPHSASDAHSFGRRSRRTRRRRARCISRGGSRAGVTRARPSSLAHGAARRAHALAPRVLALGRR